MKDNPDLFENLGIMFLMMLAPLYLAYRTFFRDKNKKIDLLQKEDQEIDQRQQRALVEAARTTDEEKKAATQEYRRGSEKVVEEVEAKYSEAQGDAVKVNEFLKDVGKQVRED